MFRQLQAALLFALSFAVVVRSDPVCHYPDGTVSPNDIPCNATAEYSACCGADAICLGNGACFTGGLISRGSCTKKDWDDSSCCPYCQQAGPSAGASIFACKYYNTGNTFTCTGDPGTCSDAFTMSNVDSYFLREQQVASVVSAYGIATTSTAADASATGNGSALAAAVTTTVTASASTTSVPDASDSYTAGALAGTAVGIGLPLLIVIGILSFLLVREKKKHQQQAQAEAEPKNQAAYNQQPNYSQPAQVVYESQQKNWPPYHSASGNGALQQEHPAPLRELSSQGDPQELDVRKP